MKQDVSPCSLIALILFESLSQVESTREGHHKLSISAYSKEYSLSGVFQNDILPADS